MHEAGLVNKMQELPPNPFKKQNVINKFINNTNPNDV